MLLPIVLYLSLVPVCFGAAIPVSCGSIYKSFAQCLVTLGDSLEETQKDPSTQDINAICRSWNAFHACANAAVAGCPGEAADVWESLRQESRKTQFSGNLYNLCASRTTLSPNTVPVPKDPPTSDQTNQETLKGQTYKLSPTLTALFPVFSTLLVLLRS
uniref:neuritin 1-like b n=1 Tax=Monopterus albus TaxID=43700 RepID=UPI0009B46A05|nr:neuritin-like protein [Monopterus albus]